MLQKQDKNAQIVFVEGVRDTAFWEKVVPTAERCSVSVYPIDTIVIEGNEGGCKGRAIRLAEILINEDICDRVVFFLDADESEILDQNIPNNIILTDFRDLEGYALSELCVSMILFSLGKNDDISQQLFENCCEISKDIGLLRLANTISELGLPFKSAFVKHPNRVLTRNGLLCTISVQGLVNRLLQYSNADEREIFSLARESANEFSEGRNRMEFVRGKDFLIVLSHCVNESLEFCQSLFMMHLVHSIDSYRHHPRFSKVENFLRQ